MVNAFAINSVSKYIVLPDLFSPCSLNLLILLLFYLRVFSYICTISSLSQVKVNIFIYLNLYICIRLYTSLMNYLFIDNIF